jgi:hypothetical protein
MTASVVKEVVLRSAVTTNAWKDCGTLNTTLSRSWKLRSVGSRKALIDEMSSNFGKMALWISTK